MQISKHWDVIVEDGHLGYLNRYRFQVMHQIFDCPRFEVQLR